jgi:hypothetical protein
VKSIDLRLIGGIYGLHGIIKIISNDKIIRGDI